VFPVKHLAVTAAVIERGGAYLLCRRHRAGELPGKWEFPGGKIEPEETPEACIAREIREELGLEFTPTRHLGTVELRDAERHLSLQVFCGTVRGGSLDVRDHEEIAWVEPAHVLSYDLAPADIEVGRWIARGDCEPTL
jgi:8-oxo-dGTP diphosphatase